ncbi:MAG: hypothetical protein JXA60_00480 [Candidatus Coatesbacteria bacterium]|nr:hypothetical protein [Candidatus Coatesbacteria bacterium]
MIENERKLLIEKLKKNKVNFKIINDSLLFVPAFGGRLFAIFLKDNNLLWTNPDFRNRWNKGGHRTWIAPEGGKGGFFFSLSGKKWNVPPSLDPASYSMNYFKEKERIDLQSDVNIKNNSNQVFNLEITRTYSEIKCSPCSISFTFQHQARNKNSQQFINTIALWSILQVQPPGYMFIGNNDLLLPESWSDKYYEKIPEGFLMEENGYVMIRIEGGKRFKSGFHPASDRGKLAYIFKKATDFCLVTKECQLFKDNIYIDKPIADYKGNGHPLQVYNHYETGRKAFAELECHSPSISLKPGARYGFDIKISALLGKKKTVEEKLEEFLGLSLKRSIDV